MMNWKEQKELRIKEQMHKDVVLLSSNKKKRKRSINVEDSKKTVEKLLKCNLLKEKQLEEARNSQFDDLFKPKLVSKQMSSKKRKEFLRRREALRKQKEEEKRLFEAQERERSLKRSKSLMRKRVARTPRKSTNQLRNDKSMSRLSSTKPQTDKKPFKRSSSFLLKNQKNQNLKNSEEPRRKPLIVPSPHFTESFTFTNTSTTNTSLVVEDNSNIILQEPKSSKSSTSSSSDFIIEDFTISNQDSIPCDLTFKKPLQN